jgi:hypothetical protein
MKRDINLYEMIDLIHVPGVNRALAAKVKEWEEQGLAACEEEYERRRRHYYKKMCSPSVDEILSAFKSPKDTMITSFASSTQLYWFELIQYEEWQWRMVHLEPQTPFYNHQYKILPMDIIERMAETPVNPDQVVTMKGIRSPSLKKKMDVQFVRYSSTHIFGTVKEHTGPSARVCWEGDLETAFQTFFKFKNILPHQVNGFVVKFMANLPPEILQARSNTAREIEKASAKKDVQELGNKLEKVLELLPIPSVPEPDTGETDESKDVNLYRLIRLARLPVFNEMLKWELRQLKEERLKAEIDAYDNYKLYMWATWIMDFKRKKRFENGCPRPYFFKLTKFSPADFGMTGINPWPPPYEHYKELLPEPLIKYLTDIPVDPGRVMEKTVELPDPDRKIVDLRWLRYSTTCIIGMVCENIDDLKNLVENQQQGLDLDVNDPEAVSKLYRLLFCHMRRHPDLAKTFINSFMKDMLPKLNNRA